MRFGAHSALGQEYLPLPKTWGFPGGAGVKNPPANAGDARCLGLIPGSGGSPEGGMETPLLGNSMDREAWWTTVYGAAKSQT